MKDTINLLTDWYADELFDYPGERAQKIIFDYSRLVVDVERFKTDPMESVNKGYIYKSDVYGSPIFRDDDIFDVCETLYDNHHENLNLTVGTHLALFSKVVIVDCHTFNNDRLPWEDKSLWSPDICIGSDEYHTPNKLLYSVVNYFTSRGLTVNINTPYSGTIVPSFYYKKDKDVSSIMIEVNKRLYLNDKYKKNEDFDEVKRIISGALDTIYEWEED
jgi:N-formylglutamate amidohydrolase